MKINKNIFKAYDIRGTYPGQINEEVCYLIGRIFLQLIRAESKKRSPKIVIGQDARPSSPKLFQALAQGIIEEGGRVTSIGQCMTPELYFAVNFLEADGGLMITASHNPPSYNGLKVTRKKAVPVSGETGLNKIKDGVINLAAQEKYKKKEIDFKRKDIDDYYVQFLTTGREIDLSKKIAVDCGNGMAGPVVKKVLEKLNINYIPLYFKPDCTFPNHEANPLKPETLKDIKKSIIENKAILGIAFDGDADRVGFLDSQGELIRGDFITGILAEKILKKRKGASIIYDLRSTRAVPECIKENGGKPIETRVGHSFIKALMREKNAVFAGELSSHFYFPFQIRENMAYFESSIRAVLETLALISETGEDIGQLVAPLQKYYQSGEVNFEVENKNAVLEKLEQKYSEGKISHLDGLKVEYQDWWFNVRPSNTEPLLRLNLEAKTEKLMQEKLEEIKSYIQSFSRK